MFISWIFRRVQQVSDCTQADISPSAGGCCCLSRGTAFQSVIPRRCLNFNELIPKIHLPAAQLSPQITKPKFRLGKKLLFILSQTWNRGSCLREMLQHRAIPQGLGTRGEVTPAPALQESAPMQQQLELRADFGTTAICPEGSEVLQTPSALP